MKTLTNDTARNELSSLLASLQEWNMIMLCDRNKAVKKFMENLFELYSQYFQYHPQQVEVYTKDYFHLLASCMPLINDQIETQYNEATCPCCNDNDAYLTDNEWFELCRLSSTIEAFHDMFQKHVGFLDDEYIRKHICDHFGEEISTSDIPENIPQDHWWWFNKRLPTNPNEIVPPWIRYYHCQPDDLFWQQSGKTYLYSLWLPYWKTLSQYERRMLVSRWPQPNSWRIFLTTL